jgi:hypothetical protein
VAGGHAALRPEQSGDPSLQRFADLRPNFGTFFSAESYFPQKIPWNLLEKRFFKTFSAENSNFFQHFLGESFVLEPVAMTTMPTRQSND